MGLPYIQESEVETLTIISPREEHTHTIILLHDRDSNAWKFSTEFLDSRDSDDRTLPEIFPSVKWVFPTSGQRSCERLSERFPGAQRPQWFDMWDIDSPSEREEMQIVGLKESVSFILEVVRTEVESLGTDGAKKVVLGGVKQGCATAIWALLCGEMGLGGFVGIGGWLPLSERVLGASASASASASAAGSDSTNSLLQEIRTFLPLPSASTASNIQPIPSTILQTPLFLNPCTKDFTVDIQNGRKFREALEGLGMNTQWSSCQSYFHWFTDPGGMDDLVAFLSNGVQVNQRPNPNPRRWDDGLF